MPDSPANFFPKADSFTITSLHNQVKKSRYYNHEREFGEMILQKCALGVRLTVCGCPSFLVVWRVQYGNLECFMAATSLLALLDDIASVLDDVAAMSKIATRKTVGLLGDDLALNAEQVSGVRAERELPVVWAVAKGSLLNKLILVPAALGISAVAPWFIGPVLMLGGAYLCYEGFEKVAHKFLETEEGDLAHRQALIQAVADPKVDLVAFEKNKIKGAIRTDFILSAEIIVIALGSVADADFLTRALVVSFIALLMTVGVYIMVAGIVKLDDAGLYFLKNTEQSLLGRFKRRVGRRILIMAPVLMKTLSVVGTIAMFLVGGGILVHGLPFMHHILSSIVQWIEAISAIGVYLAILAPTIVNGLVG